MNAVGTTVRIALSGLMFLDNAGWFGGAGLGLLRNGRDISFFPNPIYIRRSTCDVLHRLNDKVFAGGLVVSNARDLSYQVIVYTPLRACTRKCGTRLIRRSGSPSSLGCYRAVEI